MRKFVVIVLCAQALLIPVAERACGGFEFEQSQQGRDTETRRAERDRRTVGSVEVNVTLHDDNWLARTSASTQTSVGSTATTRAVRSTSCRRRSRYLRQEFLGAQSPKIQRISGATYTSQAFEQSLQSALLKVKK